MYLHYLLLTVVSVVRLHEVDVAVNGRYQNIDINGVCHYDSYSLYCPLSDVGKLPSFQHYDHKLNLGIYFSCNKSSSGSVFDITLTNSIFGDNDWDNRFVFGFKHCNFIWSPDLLNNVVMPAFQYDLRERSADLELYFFNQLFLLDVYVDNTYQINSLSQSLQGSLVHEVTVITDAVDYPQITSKTFTNMPNLTSIHITSYGSLQSPLLVQSRAFWRLPDHIGIIFSADYFDYKVALETKAISEIAIVDSVTFDYLSDEMSIISRLEIGAFDSITTISKILLHVMHDAFQGPIFSDVSHIGSFVLNISPSYPNCTLSSVQCMVNIDRGETKVDRLDIAMSKTTFVLQSTHSLSRVDTLGIYLQVCEYDSPMIYYWGDPWFEAANTQGIIRSAKTVEFNVGYLEDDPLIPSIFPCNANQTFFLPINFTNTVLEIMQAAVGSRYASNPVCDSSWLTVPKSLKSLQLRLYRSGYSDGSNPYPLIIRSLIISNITTVLIPPSYYIKSVDCACSISWLKQVMDCPTGVKLSGAWLENKCSFDVQTTVAQFLNSTRCCSSTEPPTTNNEPNMPLDCDKIFLPIPPELLYFNHTDLPQCRESGDWEWDPCDVLAYYNRFASTTKTTNPTTATTTKPTTVTSTSTVASTTHVPWTTTYSPDTTVVTTTPRVSLTTTSESANLSTITPIEWIGIGIGIGVGLVIVLVIGGIVCYKCSPSVRRPFNHLRAMTTDIDIRDDDERKLYIDAISANIEKVVARLDWQAMVAIGRTTIIPDVPDGELTIFSEADYDHLANPQVSGIMAKIKFLDKMQTKPRLTVQWFLVQLIKNGHHDVVDQIRKSVEARKLIRNENGAEQVEMVHL